jgi:hypothetical protein
VRLVLGGHRVIGQTPREGARAVRSKAAERVAPRRLNCRPQSARGWSVGAGDNSPPASDAPAVAYEGWVMRPVVVPAPMPVASFVLPTPTP